MQRLGLYGGSFDPVHLGHLLVAQAAIEELKLDRLVFVPAARSPFKPQDPLASDAARLRMLRLSLAGRSDCEVDDQEIQRGGTSFAIDTARDYHQRHPQAQLFYLIGADNLSALPKWRDADDLARLLEFVVVPRPGQHCDSSVPPFRVRVLSGCPIALSSSQIRARIKDGRSVNYLVPPTVAEFIVNNRLYL